MVAGRLAVFGAAGPQQPWLAARLLSQYVAHGTRVEAAIKDIARCVLCTKDDPRSFRPVAGTTLRVQLLVGGDLPEATIT